MGSLPMKEELLKGLSEEQIAKVKACKNQEEILQLAKKEGVELSEEQLEAVSGGGCTVKPKCPFCKSERVLILKYVTGEGGCPLKLMECSACNKNWYTDA